MFKFNSISASLVVVTTGSDIAGENFSLSCTSSGSQSEEDQMFVWTGPNELILNPTDLGIILEDSKTSDTFTSTLKFSPLQATHRGNYRCTVTFQGNSESNSTIVNAPGNLATSIISEECIFYYI